MSTHLGERSPGTPGGPRRTRQGSLIAAVGVASLLASLGLGLAVTAGGRTGRDLEVAHWLARHGGAQAVPFAHLMTRTVSPTNGGLLLVVVAAVLARRSRRWAPLLVASAALAACTLAVLGQKHGFARPGHGGELVHGGAYPSGHTATALVVGLTLVLLLRRRRRGVTAAGTAAALAVTGVLGASMVVARYHWATDILGGLLTGLAVFCVTVGVASVCRLPTRG